MSDQDEGRIAELCQSVQNRLAPRRQTLEELSKARQEAAVEAAEALALAEQSWGLGDIRLVPILGLLAQSVRTARFGEVDGKPVPHLLRALAIVEASQPDDLAQLADLYHYTGTALRTAGDLRASRDMLSKAISAFEKLGRPDDVSFSVSGLAITLLELDPEAALPACRKWVELESAQAPYKMRHFAALEQLGRCLVLAGHGEEALSVLLEAKGMLVDRAKGDLSRWLKQLDAELDKAQSLLGSGHK